MIENSIPDSNIGSQVPSRAPWPTRGRRGLPAFRAPFSPLPPGETRDPGSNGAQGNKLPPRPQQPEDPWGEKGTAPSPPQGPGGGEGEGRGERSLSSPGNPMPDPPTEPDEASSDEKLLKQYWDRTAANWERIKGVQEAEKQYVRYFRGMGWCHWRPKLACWSPIRIDEVTAILGAQNRGPAVGRGIIARGSFFKEADWFSLAKWVRKQDPVSAVRPASGWVSFRNGVVNLNDMTLHPHPRPFDTPHYSSGIDMDFTPGGLPYPVFQFFCNLASWDPLRLNLIRWDIRRVALGDPGDQMALILAGKGGTGKSTYLEWVKTLALGAAAQLAAQDLGLQFHISRLRGARVAIVDELPIRKLSSTALQTLKIAVSGGTLTGEEKHGMIDEFDAHCVVLAATNETSLIDINQGYRDTGLARRFVTVPVEFELPYGLATDTMGTTLRESTPAILAWAMGLGPLVSPRGLAPVLSTHLVHGVEEANPDPVLAWALEHCRYLPQAQTPIGKNDETFDTLWGNYLNYLRKLKGARSRVPHDFVEQLRKAADACGVPFVKQKKKDGVYVVGIALARGAGKGAAHAKRLALKEVGPLQAMRDVNVFTTLTERGIAPFSYNELSSNRDVLNRRSQIMQNLGLTTNEVGGLERAALTEAEGVHDHLPETAAELEDNAVDAEMSKRFDADEVVHNPVLDSVLYARLAPGIKVPEERMAVLLRNSKGWARARASRRDLEAFYECDLFDLQSHFTSVEIPSARHLDWSKPYPHIDAMRQTLGKVQTFPLSAGRIHSVLNELGADIIPSLYAKHHKVAVEARDQEQPHDRWFLPNRPFLKQAFALAYTEPYGSVYPRLQPVPNHPKVTVLSQNKTVFKLEVYRELMARVNGDFELHTIDLKSCHSFIYSGLFGNQVQDWNTALEAPNLWEHLAATLPSDLIPGAAGENFYWVKKQLKIWVYKAIQGGSLFNKQGDHEPLKQLFPSLSHEEREEKGDAIVRGTPPLMDLTKLSQEVKQFPEIYYPTSLIPFRYSFKKEAPEKNKLSPFTIYEWQSLPDDDLPHFVGHATGPQKVARVLTGNEIVLLMVLIVTVARERLGIVLANEADGLTVMTRSGEGDRLVQVLNDVIGAFSESFIGARLTVEGTLTSRSTVSALSQS